MLEIALLGHFEVRSDGERIDLPSRIQQKLLAYLALRAGQTVPRAKLAGLLWPDVPEATARKNLRHHLWRLRQALGEECLVTSRATVALDAAALGRLDADVLAQNIGDGDIAGLVEVVSAYDGELLPGFYDDWVQVERERVQAIFEKRMQILLDWLTAEARWLELLTWSEHWIAHAQAPEPAYRSLMTGCAGLGDMAGVTINYWRCKKALKQSLAVEPSAETHALFERLTTLEKPADVAPFDSVRDIATFPDPVTAARGTEIQFADGLRLALADLRNGSEGAIDWLSQLIRDWPGAGRAGDLNQHALASEIRSAAEQQSITDEATSHLLRLIHEPFNRKAAHLPDFLKEGGPDPDRRIFVGRQAELDHLKTLVDDVQKGQGQVAFVTGDVGSGKTSLLSAFAAMVGDSHPDSLLAWGTSNAFSGLGDPYLPFRKVLNMLTGDLHQTWSAGTITTDQARKLWQAMPSTTEALLDYGPDLLDTIIPARPLLNRLQSAFPSGHPVVNRLEKTVAAQELPGEREKIQLFEQIAATLRRLAEREPVVILLDDLQWADRGSIDLLFHLGRSLAGARILLLSAYRPDEVMARRDHPLGPLLAEFRRSFGDIWLDLNRAPGRTFVEALIDSEPNRLDQSFRESLYQSTAGHPLFTVELLRDMQQRGDLVKDDSGLWTVGPSLDWEVLPARVEGAVESRLGRLEDELRDILTVAAVEGEVFTAQVVAQVQEIQEQTLLQTLSRELRDRYQFVQEDHREQFGQQQIHRFRFAHQMYQRYLYDRLSTAERGILHGRVGQVLEDLYDTKSDEQVVQLARHFDEAGDSAKAATYFLAAGDRARSLYALEEAADHYRRALEHLHRLGDDERLARTWMRLGLTYHNAFEYRRSLQAYNQGFEYWQKVEPSSQEQDGEVTLRLWQPEPATLDPTSPGDDDTGIWRSQLFSGLVTIGPENVIVPDVAHRWALRDGGRTYIFHLRQDVRWSDGQPLTAHDFILAWQRVLEPGSPDDHAERLIEIKGAEAFHQGHLADEQHLGLRAPDDRTLVIELDRPAHYLLHMLAAPYLFPVPAHAIKRFGRDWAEPQHIVTNGPFKVLSWSAEDGVRLTRNPFYHGTFAGNVSRVEVSLLKPEVGWHEGMDQYVNGQVDFLDVSYFPGDVVRATRRRFGEYYTTLLPRPTTVCIGFNLQKPPLDDVRLRQALALAIDQEQFVRDLQKDDAVPALGGYVPYGLPGHSPDIGWPYDPAAARRLLAEAGYAGGKDFPPLEIAWFDFPNSRENADYISQLWLEELGVTIRPTYVAFRELVNAFDQGRPPRIFSTGWTADYPDPDNFLRIGLGNSIRGHQRILNKIEAARKVTDQGRRLSLYQEADKMVIGEALCIPLYYGSYPVFFGPRVRKISSDFRWSDFILDPD